jgi:hypothetical protein
MPSTTEFNADLASRFARWLRVQEYTANTNRLYLASVVSLCQFLNDIPATEVTHLDIRDFLASIAQKGLKRATIWRAMSALRCFFDFLNMGGLINWSPPRFVRLRRLDKPYPNQVFTIVIWGSNRSKFGTPENDYKGKRICVIGKISAYAGLPEIVADEPKQIKIDSEK